MHAHADAAGSNPLLLPPDANSLSTAGGVAAEPSGMSTAAEHDDDAVGHGASTSDAPASSSPLDILEKLEELEILAEQRARAQAEDDDINITSITTAHGLVLTKQTRLPDAVLLPRD